MLNMKFLHDGIGAFLRMATVTAFIFVGHLLLSGTALSATYGQQVVAGVLMGEAEGEGIKGMYAVAEVIKKRCELKQLSPLAIVKEPKQFSCLNNITPPQLIRKHWRKKSWSQALFIARILYNHPQKLTNYTKGATHYATFIPYWAKNKKPTIIIGRHIFWDLKRI